MTNWRDKNGNPIEIGSLVEAKGNRWTVSRFRKNTVVMFRHYTSYKHTRRVEEFAYPSTIEVVS